MQFALTEEQAQFKDVVGRFLRQRSPPTEVRRLMQTESGFDPLVWRQLAQDLAVCGIHVPEAYGGTGFGMTELGIVLEAMGGALYCGPFFASTVLAATTILELGSDDEKQAMLPSIAAGACIATLAFVEAGGSWQPAATTLVAADQRLSGTKHYVLDGHVADCILVLARDTDTGALSIYRVDGAATGLTRTPLSVLDRSRRLAMLRFDNTPATRLGIAGRAEEVMDRVLVTATIALANEMIGGAGQMLDSALAYTKLRAQFGRKIASFQAIKHRLADLLLEVELARSAAYYAAAAADAGDPNLPALASLAKSACAEAYMHAAAECIQLHGGIGFTWDNDTHLWFKRAKSSEVFLGDPAWHRERMLACWKE